jgi:HEAT repeat protein
MNIADILNSKSQSPKAKVEALSKGLLEGALSITHLVRYAQTAKDAHKASCVEAMEFATRQNPPIADTTMLNFVTASLTATAPRVKWESAKVVGHIAQLFPLKLEKAIVNLLNNAEHPGTVVRWAAAFALGQILLLKTTHNRDLLPAIEAICKREANTGVKKIYLAALKKIRGS